MIRSKKINIKKFKYISIFVFLFISVAIVGFIQINNKTFSYAEYETFAKINGYIGWGTFLFSLYTWKRLRHELFSAYTVFLTVFYLFTFGHSLIFALGYVPTPDWLVGQIGIKLLVYSQVFTLLGLICFHIGALCSSVLYNNKNKRIDDNITSVKDYNNMMSIIKYTGIILLVFSFPSFIYNTINTIFTVLEGGYSALYSYSNSTSLKNTNLLLKVFSFTSMFFLPSLICLLIAYKKHLHKRRLILLIMLIVILNSLFVGDRGEAVRLLLIIVLTYHYVIKQIRKKSALILGTMGYVIVSFLTVVARLRSSVNRSISDYFTMFIKASSSENLFIQTIVELGGSMFPLAKIIEIFPNQVNYWYGISYVYSMISIIPNLGFWDVHPAIKYAEGPNWLMKYLNYGYGPGFSLHAEAFRNFGWAGIFVFFLYGVIFGRLYSSINKSSIFEKPEKLTVVLIFLYLTMTSVRGDNLYIIRPLFYIVFPILIIMKFIKSYLKRNPQKSSISNSKE